MSRTLSEFLSERYESFRNGLISDWGVSERRVQAMDEKLKPLHSRFLSVSCAASIASYRGKRCESAQGIIEVSGLSLVMAIKGLENPSCCLLRQAIELALKHIYFLNHPVEYGWATSRVDYKELNYQFLIDYLARTDDFKAAPKAVDWRNRIDYWYGILSRYVHVQSKDFMTWSLQDSARRPAHKLLAKMEERASGVWPALTVLLITSQLSKFRKASLPEQRLLKLYLPADIKRLF
jgi:hypothetical protein